MLAISMAVPSAVFTAGQQAAQAASTKSPAKQGFWTNKATNPPNNNPLCGKIGKSVQVSQGGQMFCFGPHSTTSAQAKANTSAGTSFGSNVDAANPQEDVTPSGVAIPGQSETSIAAAGPYVVEAWNDGTGFFAPCGSPQSKDQLTGYGFSTDGGKSFRDLGGLPNNQCSTSIIAGDPSVEAYTVGGSTYFYISSIFIPFSVPENAMSVTACKVTGSGSTATLACGQPIVAAISSDCQSFYGFFFCSFLDKEFLSIDPGRSRLYMSYTEFGPSTGFSGVIELAMCDLSSPASPTCHNGSSGSITGQGRAAAPYFVVAPGDANFCENEGAYPAVDTSTGDVYVVYEHDWFSALFNCGGEAAQNVMNYVPFACLTATPTSPCGGPVATRAVNIVSMAAQLIPGYNRFPMNDFPRIAVSNPSGTVSMVWNDGRLHQTGDILLQSFNLGTLALAQAGPVRVNSKADSGGWNFLPALRNVAAKGTLNVSFYNRASANTALTDVHAALGIDPRAGSGSKGSDTSITTGSSDWNAVSSIIVPNFGDYTDNYVAGATLYVAWSDGRLGIPQPFEDSVGAH
jgi:hypothetical protein